MNKKISAGKGEGYRQGGSIQITSSRGKVEINDEVYAGDGGSRGGSGGRVSIVGEGANGVELKASASVAGGKGGNRSAVFDPSGRGGHVTINGQKYVSAQSAIVRGGDGGNGGTLAGGDGGDVNVYSSVLIVPNRGTTTGGKGGTSGGKKGNVYFGPPPPPAPPPIRPPRIQGVGRIEGGYVKIVAGESITMEPGDSIRGGSIDLVVSGSGTLIDLQGIASGAIQADTCIRLRVERSGGQILLRGAQSSAIITDDHVGSDICINGQPIMDEGVTLADLTSPAARNPMKPCPVPCFSVLVFSKTNGFRHDSIPDGIDAIKELGAENTLTVVATEDASVFTDENLVNYEVVVFLNTSGTILDDAQKAATEGCKIGHFRKSPIKWPSRWIAFSVKASLWPKFLESYT